MSNHAPYYRWFPKDYNADPLVQGMTDDQDLAYRRMLDASWELGGLPNDPAKLAAIVRYDVNRFRQAWTYPLTECWEPIGRRKMLVNNRQESERELFLSKRTQGREAARERWKKQRKRMGIKEKPGNAGASVRHSGRNADAMLNGCLPDPDPDPVPNPEPKAAKRDPRLPVPAKPPSNKEASSASELAPNPFRFIAYWQDANSKRDFGITFEPVDGFEAFMTAETKSLGLTMSRGDLGRFAQRSIVKFCATYSRRDIRGKTRGGRIGPARLTEELVGWIRTDLANVAGRQTSKPNTRAQRMDEQTKRLMGK